METTTKNGMKVSLNVEGNRIVAEITHPQLGKVVGKGDKWGVVGNSDAGLIVDATIKGKRSSVCLTIDNTIYRSLIAEIEAAKAAREEKRQAELREKALAECPVGKVIARCISTGDGFAFYRTENGIELSDSDLLENNYGWYYVSLPEVESETARLEKKAERKVEAEKAEKARVEELKALAIKTGVKQLLKTDAIETGRDENSLILRQTWAMPDGIVETRIVNAH